MAQSREPEASVPVYLLLPPYHELQVAASAWSKASPPPAGSVVLVRPLPDQPWIQVAATAEQLEARLATASLVLWLDLVLPNEAAGMAFHAATTGIEAIIPGSMLSISEVRKQLADAPAFPDRFERWLRHAVPAIQPDISAVLHGMARVAGRRSTLKGYCAEAGTKLRTVERQFRASGMGSPGAWFGVLVFFRRVFFLVQSTDAERMAEIAERLRFHDQAGLRRRCRDVVGRSPSGIQKLAGWKWALHAALERRGLLLP